MRKLAGFFVEKDPRDLKNRGEGNNFVVIILATPLFQTRKLAGFFLPACKEERYLLSGFNLKTIGVFQAANYFGRTGA